MGECMTSMILSPGVMAIDKIGRSLIYLPTKITRAISRDSIIARKHSDEIPRQQCTANCSKFDCRST